MRDVYIEMYEDRGDWITTYTGRRFYPLDPQPEDIYIEDIAHSLSLLNRFTGHTKFPYSVAQHSIKVSEYAYGHELAGLLHDASEAYVNDLARSLKQYLPKYKEIENKILDVIDTKFNVNTRAAKVKEIDTRTLVTEASQLCNGEQWYFGPCWPPSLNYAVYECDWFDVEYEFIYRFELLGGFNAISL